MANKDDVVLFCFPKAMEGHVLYRYHDEMGHLGVDKVTELISSGYWFPMCDVKLPSIFGTV